MWMCAHKNTQGRSPPETHFEHIHVATLFSVLVGNSTARSQHPGFCQQIATRQDDTVVSFTVTSAFNCILTMETTEMMKTKQELDPTMSGKVKNQDDSRKQL